MRALKIQMTSILTMLCLFAAAQNTVLLEGYVYEENNRGLLSGVEVKILDHITNELEASLTTGVDGAFAVRVPKGRKFKVATSRKNYFDKEDLVSTIGLRDKKKVFVKIEMERKPGYIFDVTLAESREQGTATVLAIDSARIEIYNNTTRVEELVLLNHPSPVFKFIFEPGHHYTIMIRKKDFFNKRIEAYVDIEGCILCFDGLGSLEPGVLDILTSDHSKGTFLANVELEPIEINKTYEIENIYYDFDKWNIRADAAVELDKLTTILKDNQHVIVELGSHTDARGNDGYNLTLSEKRAKAAVEYLVSAGGINDERLQSKGYGEEELINRCTNGVNCTENEHQRNRRTELKIIGTIDDDPLENKSLKQIIEEAEMEKHTLTKKGGAAEEVKK